MQKRLVKSIAGLLFFAVIAFGAAVRAQADAITISITNESHLRTVPGSTILLTGTLTNTTSSVLFVNSSGGALNNNQPPNTNIVLDAFYFIRPNQITYILQPGQSTGVISLVNLFINPAAPDPSVTLGTIDICGGANLAACDQLGRAPFRVVVSTLPEPETPEPGSIVLLGTGIAGVAAAARRRRKERG